VRKRKGKKFDGYLTKRCYNCKVKNIYCTYKLSIKKITGITVFKLAAKVGVSLHHSTNVGLGIIPVITGTGTKFLHQNHFKI
jgi:hypothetical protein